MKKMSVVFMIFATGVVAIWAATHPGAAKAQDRGTGWSRQQEALPWSEENYGIDVRTTATASRKW